MSDGQVTRRTFLKQTGAAGVAVAGGTLWATAPAAARARRVATVPTPIEHLVIACQENRSFDHYYGYAPQVQALGFGPPAGFYQPDSGGGKHFPFEFTNLSTPDPPHSWSAVHQQYDGGKMDGFWQAAQDAIGDGDAAIGYYTANDSPSTTACLRTRRCAPTTTARCLAPRGRTASTFQLGRPAGSRPTASGVTGYSTTQSSLTCSTRRA